MTHSNRIRRFLETGEGNADHLVDAAKLVSRLNEKPFVDWLAAVLDLHYEVQAAHERGEPVHLSLKAFAWELGVSADFAVAHERMARHGIERSDTRRDTPSV